ncbi:hypothetical protein ScPMuIL_016985 [Solemya velum]
MCDSNPGSCYQSDHSDSLADETEAVEVVEDVEEAVQSEESQTSSVDSKQQRAKKANYSLGAEVEVALVEWIQENQILWNSKLIDFKRTDPKEALCREKGQQLGRDAAYPREWWRSIKDNFTRLDKKKSGDETKELTEREEWILSACSFLRPLVRHKSQPLRSIKGCDTLTEQQPPKLVLQTLKKDTCPEDTSYTRKDMTRKQDDTSTLEALQENLLQSSQVLKQLTSVEPAPFSRRATFANFVRDSLLTMSKPKYKMAKASMWDILRQVYSDDDSSSQNDGNEPAVPYKRFPEASSSKASKSSSTSSNLTSSEQYQPPPNMWRRQAPPSSYVEQYCQQQEPQQYQQQQLTELGNVSNFSFPNLLLSAMSPSTPTTSLDMNTPPPVPSGDK